MILPEYKNYIKFVFVHIFYIVMHLGIIDYNLSIVNHIVIDNNVTQLVVVDSTKPCISHLIQNCLQLIIAHHIGFLVT